jgi:hypothetical protein
VSPPGGVTGSGAAPGKPVTVTLKERWIKDTPEDSLRKIGEIYPDYLEDGKTNPVFSYDSGNNQVTNRTTIFEEVYIEVPCDTDEDGKRDLVRIHICRPYETGIIIDEQTGETLISVPVLMNHSPYNIQTTTRRPLWLVVGDQKVNSSTAALAYKDIMSKKPRADNWFWGLDAKYWDNEKGEWVNDAGGAPSWYVNGRASIPQGAWFIPDSRGDKDVVFQGNWPTSRNTPSGNNRYFYDRGYAIVTSSSLGNTFGENVAEGFNNCGDVEETLAPMAII